MDEHGYQPKPEEIIHLEGADDGTLFWGLKLWLIADHTESFQSRLDKLWDHYRNIKDERLLALIGALCIETALDSMLDRFIPGYDDFKKDTDVTHSLKIKMAKALHLIPRQILNSCDLVRQIRNDFAHNLSLSRFQQLPRKHLNKLGPYVREYNTMDRDWEDWVGLYRELIGFTASGLIMYSYQLQALRAYLKTSDFREHFKNYVERKKDKP